MSEEISMIDLGIDLSTVEKPEPLPVGTYRGVISEAVKATSATSGNDYLRQIIVVPPDEYPADYDVQNAPDGVKLRYFSIPLSVAGNRRAAYRLRSFLEKFGIPLTSSLDLSALVGKEVSVTIKHVAGFNDPESLVEEVEAVDAI